MQRTAASSAPRHLIDGPLPCAAFRTTTHVPSLANRKPFAYRSFGPQARTRVSASPARRARCSPLRGLLLPHPRLRPDIHAAACTRGPLRLPGAQDKEYGVDRGPPPERRARNGTERHPGNGMAFAFLGRASRSALLQSPPPSVEQHHRRHTESVRQHLEGFEWWRALASLSAPSSRSPIWRSGPPAVTAGRAYRARRDP